MTEFIVLLSDYKASFLGERETAVDALGICIFLSRKDCMGWKVAILNWGVLYGGRAAESACCA
jgi:hypothetical protein